MIPTLSPELEEFLRTIIRTYGDELAQYKKQTPKEYTNDPDALTISYTKLFASPKYQFVFKTYAKSKGLRGETYEVGKPGGESKYRSTKIMWDNLWMYQKFTASPALRGRLTNNTIVYDPMRYTGMNKPKVESIETDTEGFDFDEIDFGEKYSAIDATESEWNEFWSLFEQNKLHKAKAQMLNYYNQYLEYIESMGNSSSDELMKAHQYKEKIDKMTSDPKRNSDMNIYDTRGLTYANYRKEQLIPISDEEFINESLDIKSYMLNLLSLNKDNADLVERYNNEIAYLVECKYIESLKLDRDSINWEYMNLLEHGFDDTGFNMKYRRENWCGYRYPLSYEMPIWLYGIDIPQLLKSYSLLERSNITSDLESSYQIGVDTDSGKLVCVKFSLMPRRNDGLRIIRKDGKLIKLSDSVNDIVTRAGHIDSVSGSDTVNSIIYHDDTICNENGAIVHMLPIESEEVREFLGKMYNYDSDLMKKFIIMSNDTNDGFILSLSDAFANPKVQRLFIAFVKQFNYQPIEHEVSKACGSNVYDCTYIPWDPILMYQRFGDAPKFEGPISNTTVKSLGSPSFIDDRSFEYKESYDPNEVNDRLKKIRNNIKKYEEAVQEYISTSNQFNIDLSSYLEADDQSEENDQENQVEDDDTPPNIDLGDEEIESDEPPTIDTDEPESTEEDTPSEDEEQEDVSEAPDIIEPTSLPKATDAQEENKNGVRRKKLYIAFIEWAKSFNQKNTFGSIFDKDAFDVTYPFVPHEMRYFYRLANPILCVLSGSLTFFQVSELRKLNSNNPDMKDALIFAATENDYRVFSTRDKKVYVGIDKEDGSGIAFTKCLADSFDLYIQNMIDQGDILNGPIASESDSNNIDENNDSDKE